MSIIQTIFLPAQKVLTITADAVSSGHVVQLNSGADSSSFQAIAASSSVVIAPSGEGRNFSLTSDNGLLTFAITQAVAGGITAIVQDTAPQLGGDLDLNSNNLDFPTTADISDVIDDDTMATASDTTLATSESIKAYADTVAGGAVTEAAVVGVLDGATLTAETVAVDDKVLIQDTSDNDEIKTVTTQSIADLFVPSFTNPMTTAADIIVGGTAGAADRLGVGSEGDVLTVSTGAVAWAAPVTGVTSLDGLTDVEIDTPTLGQVLIYDATAEVFENASLSEGQNIDITEADGSITIAVTGIEDGADVTDATNVMAALDGATIPTATVATDDKVLIQDTNDNDELKTVTAQSIADLAATGMTNPMTTAEDIIIGGTSGAPARLGVGDEGEVLTVTSGAVAWTAPAGGSADFVKITSTTISGATAEVIFTDLSTTYKEYIIVMDVVMTGDAEQMNMRFSANNGANYLVTNYEFVERYEEDQFTGQYNSTTANYHDAIRMGHEFNGSHAISNASGGQYCAVIHLINPAAANSRKKKAFFTVSYNASLSELPIIIYGTGENTSTAAITAVKLYSGVSFASGNVTLYGVKI